MFKTSASSFRLDLTNSEDSLSQKYSTILIRCGLAEFIGTAILVIIACGTCVSTHKENDTFLASSLAGGLTIVCLALAFGQVSGAHLNPAVTVGLLFNGKIDCLKALVYAICQIVGGTAGAAILSLVLPSGTQDLCPTTVSNDISPIQAIVIEITITFLLVFVVCSCGQNQISPLVIGIAVIGGHLFAVRNNLIQVKYLFSLYDSTIY